MPSPLASADAKRRARHMAKAEALQDFAMNLARLAHAKAAAELAAELATGQVLPDPQPPAGPDAPKPEAPKPDAPKPANVNQSVLTFVRLAHAVDALCAFEERAANPPPRIQATPKAAAQPAKPDPRRPTLRRLLHGANGTGVDRVVDRTDLDRRIDRVITDDDDLNSPLADLLETLLDELGLKLDITKVPDDILHLLAGREQATPQHDRPEHPTTRDDADPHRPPAGHEPQLRSERRHL